MNASSEPEAGLYRTLAENITDHIVRWDRAMRRVYVNPAFAHGMGAAADRIMGTSFGTEYSPAAAAVVRDSLAKLAVRVQGTFATGEPTEAEFCWYTAGGPRVFLVRVIPERAADGTVETVLGIGRDITALKETERQLRASEGRYRALFEESPIAVWEEDFSQAKAFVDGLLAEQVTDLVAHFAAHPDLLERCLGLVRFTDANQAAIDLLGARDKREALGGMSILFTPEAAADFGRAIGALCTGKVTRHVVDSTIQTLRGGRREVTVVVSVAPGHEQTLSRVLVSLIDVSEQKRAAESLRESELKYRTIFEESFDGLFITSPAGRILDMNRKGVAMFGYDTKEEILRLDLEKDVYAEPPDRKRILQMVEAQGTCEYDVVVKKRDGQRMATHCALTAARDEHGVIQSYRGIIRDVTEKVQLEDQLRQAQKMEAVGLLAGGIAHDFNNMLAVIQMQSSLLLERTGMSPQTKEGLREIMAATDRASNLTRQLLTFSRRQVAHPVDLDVRDTIGTMIKLLRRVLGEDVALETRFASHLPPIHADPGMMEQVLMNLAVNARDAMPRGGRLTVSLEAVTVSEEHAALHLGATPGPRVCLSVEDTGCGIPPEDLPRIFEPFFTTKGVGHGTGLGLATVFGIVQQHHGWIEVESVVNVGTTFKMFVPALATRTATVPPETPRRFIRGGDETILLVEDEPAVRAVTRIALERYGYRVLEAESAGAALELWKREGATVRLLLTDLIMPGGLTGRQLADELLAREPRLKVLYASGYSPDAVNLLGLDAGHALLQKPFSPDELAAAVRRALDQDAGDVT